MDAHALVGGVGPQVGERGGVGLARERFLVGDKYRVARERLGVIDELPGVPPERPNGKVVEAERNATAADGRADQR